MFRISHIIGVHREADRRSLEEIRELFGAAFPDYADDPAGYRAKHPHRTGLRCLNDACDQRQVRGIRRLGILGKIRIPPSPPPDPVTTAARDLRRRLTKHERQALIRELQDDE